MIIGINDGHDAGVAVITPAGEILFAANEERYTGRKQQWGFPRHSLQTAMDYLSLDPGRVEHIAFGFQGLLETESSSALGAGRVGLTRRLFTHATRFAGPLLESEAAAVGIRGLAVLMRRNRADIRRNLQGLGFPPRLDFIAHHEAHAASAFFTSGYSSACVVTIDAGGDGMSGSLWHGRDGRLSFLSALPRIHSLGDFWLAVTHLCGFNPDRHGGKITGLAAYLPCPPALDVLRQLYTTVPGRFLVRNRHYLFWKRLVARLRVELRPFNREEIAWAAQKLLEEMVQHLVAEGLRATGETNLAVAGGVFANVKLNMELLAMPACRRFFVHPHMGDGGCALGAALAVASRDNPLPARELEHVFLGDEAGPLPDGALEGFDVRWLPDRRKLAAETAAAIAAGEVVGLVQGRMEYGPRALLHRSILYHPFDPSIMDWLNERLDRTEFMPFAPFMAQSRGEEFFETAREAALPCRFMTICLPARSHTVTQAPAIVHVDGTARPQFVTRHANPFACDLLEEFEQITGVPIIINTSFNRHEQPIVRCASQALEELERKVVDTLVLEDCIVRRRGNDNR
jgi:carbamoyltransferase